MLQSFRNVFKSKIGVGLTLGFLAIIAVAFVSGDISGSGTFGGVAGGDRVAVVGNQKIGTADLIRSANNLLDRARQDENPTISMPAFLANGGLEQALDTLIDRFAFKGYANDHGIRAGENLVNSEIRSTPAFRGADGNFSEDSYRQLLAQQRLTDAQVRDDLGTSLIARQLLAPASYGSTLPDALAFRYAQLFKERRKGVIGLLPSAAYAPKGAPTDAQIKAFYDANHALFIRPERRIIQYATFTVAALGDSIEPTEAEIAARFKRDASQYAASETRTVTQLIVPTEAAAKAIGQQVAGGASFDEAAQKAGLRTAKLTDVTREAIAAQASKDVAATYFATAQGAITTPTRSSLGWHIGRIDSVNRKPQRSLAQVRGEIADALRTEKRATGLADLAGRVEEQVDEGSTFAEIVKDLKVESSTTKPLIASGQVYGTANETAPALLAPALAAAFQMDEQEPEVAPLDGGQTYLVYEVSDITPSATAPLSEIRSTVIAAWRQDAGAKAAKLASDRVLARIKAGKSLQVALSEEKLPLPGVEAINLTREDLARQNNQRIPPPLALMFSMAQGTAKRLQAPGRNGWYIVDLDSIQVDPMAKNDPLVAQAREQLGPILGQEYLNQLRLAMREEQGVERNTAAIAAVRKQLVGGN